jgi:hypothetical protein
MTDDTARGPPPGAVRRVGGWAVGTSRGEDFAVSRRCRHQLADLSGRHVDADGCPVCPWYAGRYDGRTGRTVDGPQGFLCYRSPTPGAARRRWPGGCGCGSGACSGGPAASTSNDPRDRLATTATTAERRKERPCRIPAATATT